MNRETIILITAVLFFSSFLLTKLSVFFARKQQWLDIPNARSSHVIPTPKSGGVAFVITFLLFSVYFFFQGLLPWNSLLALMMGLIAALLGLMDDLKSLHIKVRISVQITCIVIVLALLGGAPAIPVFSIVYQPGLIGFVLAVLVFTWFINLYNFMDGIDGLAGIEGIFVSMAASFFCWQQGTNDLAVLLLALSSCLFGFVLVNYPPAKVFMGDAGSNFLGLILGVLALLTIQSGSMSLWSWSILLGLFVVDSTSTLVSRYRSGEVWYHAHRSHFYQQLAIKLCGHEKVVWLYAATNLLWLFPLAWLSLKFESMGLVITLLAYTPLAIISTFYRSRLIRSNI